MPKHIYSSPRVLLVSWRAPPGAAFSNVTMWLERFRQRMALTCRHIELIDSQKIADNAADMRPDTWTDFLAVWTVVYALAYIEDVESETGSNELKGFLDVIDDGIKCGWIAKLEPEFKRDFRICDMEPWKHPRWNELPDDPSAIFPTGPNADEMKYLDKLIVAAIERIGRPPTEGHLDPPAGITAAPAADGTWQRLWQRLRGRDH